jgi:hypothetical protein
MSSELQSWFDQWWIDLPKKHFTSQNKGNRAECWSEVQKLAPDEKLREHISWYTRELTLRTAKMKSKDIKVSGWRHAVRLIRYRFFEDDLPSISNEIEKVAATKCECGKDATIQNKCWGCHESTDPQHKTHMHWLYDTLVEQGLGIKEFPDKAAWIQACKERTIPRLAKLRAKRVLEQAKSDRAAAVQ